VRSFNWGPWDGGMVSDSLKKLFEERNIQVIPVEGGTKIFVDGFRGSCEDSPQVLVGSSMQAEGGDLSPDLRTYRIVRKLNLADNPFLDDHSIGGHPVLPAAFVISWMGDTCEQFYKGYTSFRCEDYRTLKGIVFDESLSNEYVMSIEELRKDDSGEISFGVKISSHREKGPKLIHHYSARITLLRRVPEAPLYEGFDRNEHEPIDGPSLYRDGTLFHGPIFQWVERVMNVSRKKLTLRCRAPQIREVETGQFPIGTFDPYAADVQFQSMLIWVRKQYDAGSLPARAGVGEHFRPIPRDQEVYISLDVKSADKKRMVADITAHDETGKIYTRILDAEVTISKKLNDQFLRAT